MQKLRKKYANDKQKQAAEMQKLQKEHGVNPLGGCLPVLVQVPVFIGLFHVLREFGPTRNEPENYFFGAERGPVVQRGEPVRRQARRLGDAGLRGARAARHVDPAMLIVMIPLMIAAGIFTHITARHSVARQTAAQGENPQSAIMNKLMLYVFPIGVVVGAPFLPLAVLLYWVANNLWTLGQQYVVYRRIDAEETREEGADRRDRQARAPRPGQKPVRTETPGSRREREDARRQAGHAQHRVEHERQRQRQRDRRVLDERRRRPARRRTGPPAAAGRPAPAQAPLTH